MLQQDGIFLLTYLVSPLKSLYLTVVLFREAEPPSAEVREGRSPELSFLRPDAELKRGRAESG